VVPDCRFSNFLVFCATRDLVTIFEFFDLSSLCCFFFPSKKEKEKEEKKSH